jgi:hypothetical protein
MKTKTSTAFFDSPEASIGHFVIHQDERIIYRKIGGIEGRSVPVDSRIVAADRLNEKGVLRTRKHTPYHDMRGYTVAMTCLS